MLSRRYHGSLGLTDRLFGARQQRVNFRSQLEHLRIELAQYRVEEEHVQSSTAFWLAGRFWALRNPIGI